MMQQGKKIRAMMIGAHPDDCDFRCGGLALRYAQAGHSVKFLAMVDGSGGHQTMAPADIARRRRAETQAVARLAGIDYEVWDLTDCELTADLETRKRLTRSIRAFRPDVIFCSRPNDYHADHRNASLLVQDASYLLIVPHFCPESPALREMPVIMHFYDRFQNPPFSPDIMVDITDVIEDKFRMLDCHVSQMYEWLPYTKGTLDTVPTDPVQRLEWLHQPRVPRDGKLDDLLLTRDYQGQAGEYREAAPAALYRNKLVERYGERGREILFAEAFSLCEYGRPLTRELEQELFPF